MIHEGLQFLPAIGAIGVCANSSFELGDPALSPTKARRELLLFDLAFGVSVNQPL